VKPRVFIGSSSESERYALAIKARLEKIAQCTPWVAAFVLSKSTMDNLLRNLHDSDFGVFVFSADDVTSMRGTLLNVPRDNVVFEAGLFSGHLGPDRCFITVPEKTRVHIPSDLSGITIGFYEDDRDDNYLAAVSTFSDSVYQHIQNAGLFQGTLYEQFRELIVSFECSGWITEDEKRVERKRIIWEKMDGFCRTHRPDKNRLVALASPGAVTMLLVAITLNPHPNDLKLIRRISRRSFSHGFLLTKLIETIRVLISAGKITNDGIDELKKWLHTGTDLDATDKKRIDALDS
jgi:hypothetical protein